jgi:hypothetical protein
MAKGVLFIGWGPALTGRELKALELFEEVVKYYAGLQERGEIQGFEPFLLEPHGGDLAGFLLLRGTVENLARVRTSQEFIHFNTRAALVVSNFGVVTGFTGEELQEQFADYAQIVAAL